MRLTDRNTDRRTDTLYDSKRRALLHCMRGQPVFIFHNVVQLDKLNKAAVCTSAHCKLYLVHTLANKMLSYRRETALQGAL